MQLHGGWVSPDLPPASRNRQLPPSLPGLQTRHLPRFSASDAKILTQYLHSRLWLTGLGADLGGAVLQIAAFAMAPVSTQKAALLWPHCERQRCAAARLHSHCNALSTPVGLCCMLHTLHPAAACRQQQQHQRTARACSSSDVFAEHCPLRLPACCRCPSCSPSAAWVLWA